MNARLPLIVLAFAALVSACSLLVNFDPEGQPCDAQGGCLEGYGCVDGACVKGVSNIVCDQCPAGGCIPGTNECLPNTCEYKVCQPAYYCDDQGGTVPPTCRPVPSGNLGSQCVDDAFCAGANDVCMFGAIQSPSTGGLRGGICVEPCAADGTCPLGSTCRSFALSRDAGVTRVCLPQNTLSACTTDEACRREGLVCTVFDHPQIGALTACDDPLRQEGTATTGEACVRSRSLDGGGDFCANGLCIPQLPAGSPRPATCGQLCDQGGCAAGLCDEVEFSVVPEAIRYVPMCVAGITRCADCTADPGACGPDAPWCTNLNGVLRCLGACSPDAGVTKRCPQGYACSQLPDGFRCVPTLGFCPQ